MSRIAIIPARGGSKRIPKKNIRDFLGKPIIAYSIDVALKCDFFERVIVSTDDNEIAKIALELGAEVPFMRSEKTASDTATTADTLIEVVQLLKKRYETVCCIYATAPFVTSEKLSRAYDLLIKGGFDTVFPVTQFRYPTQRALALDHHAKVQMIDTDHVDTRSQDLPPTYHDAGQFYWFKPEELVATRSLFGELTGAVICDNLEVQDIDDEVDWKLAELKYKLLHLE